MSDKPSNGASAEDEVAGEAEAAEAEAVDMAEEADEGNDEDEIPVEVEDVDVPGVKVPDPGESSFEGTAEVADSSGQLSHEDLLELVGQGEQEKAALGKQFEELGQELEAVEKEKKNHYERLLRSVADMENLRKRTRKDVEDSKIDARSKAIKEILPVIDNLDRALTHAEQTTDDTAGIIDGVKLVLRQFQQALDRLDVRPVDAKGKPFDPNIHEAVSQAPSDDVPPGSCLEVLQRGYTIGDRLLRPSLVVVAQAPPAEPAPEEAEPSEAESESEAAGGNGETEPLPMPPADDEEEPKPESDLESDAEPESDAESEPEPGQET